MEFTVLPGAISNLRAGTASMARHQHDMSMPAAPDRTADASTDTAATRAYDAARSTSGSAAPPRPLPRRSSRGSRAGQLELHGRVHGHCDVHERMDRTSSCRTRSSSATSGRLPLKGAQEFEHYCQKHPQLLDEIALGERINTRCDCSTRWSCTSVGAAPAALVGEAAGVARPLRRMRRTRTEHVMDRNNCRYSSAKSRARAAGGGAAARPGAKDALDQHRAIARRHRATASR